MLRARALVPLLVAVAAVVAGGCSSTTVGTDLGIVEPGCKTPSACYRLGADCPCGRGDVDTVCKACDPNVQVCICDTGTACLQSTAVCVGRSATVCSGVGARCLPVGSSCASGMSGAPPQMVGSGASLAPRCAFVDDVCCPGVVVDLGASD
jgi:hypothetical protein